MKFSKIDRYLMVEMKNDRPTCYIENRILCYTYYLNNRPYLGRYEPERLEEVL